MNLRSKQSRFYLYLCCGLSYGFEKHPVKAMQINFFPQVQAEQEGKLESLASERSQLSVQTTAVKQQQHSLEEEKQKLREQQELVETEKRRLQQLAETLRKKSQQIQDTIHVCTEDIDGSMLQAIISLLHFMNDSQGVRVPLFN